MKKNKQNKWQKLAELQRILDEHSCLATIEGIDCKDLHCLTYAPNIGINAWIFTYHKTLVVLWDDGNSHYSFFTGISRFTLFRARIACWIDTLKWKFR